ncbi:alpha/beta-hydrolase [Coprinopsis marcescibilis]|uniref:Alpha/beta-hydrolase n=1 Tax=Coprinopsis marcescibilis TaxID=230819 RepID=A0A5C3KJP8_COPMA|nr:alpha/beta-hydrolase [Coprinopsis marcescibilis]
MATIVKLADEQPFTLNVPQDELKSLQVKLQLTRLPDELEFAGHGYGMPLKDIERLLARWRDGFDWRKHESQLNAELPQFIRKIEVEGFGELDIHYVHKQSRLDTAIPLLFIHGWPGSFIEVRKILPLLTEPSEDFPYFHVAAISLPGFGFSSAPTKKGFHLDQYAEVCHKLMLALGYNEYVVQGGDWGFYVGRRIANLYGKTHCKAWHTNFPRNINSLSPPSFWTNPLSYLKNLITPLTQEERAGLEHSKKFQKDGRGYSVLQATRPQTLGYLLGDSPVGLLAWIYEKLVSWSDNYPWEDDEVLTWVSIYWFSRSGPASSLRIYYEATRGPGRTAEESQIPLGYSIFPKELYRPPTRWLWERNLVFTSEHDEGGHFAAHEKPRMLVGDLRRMFGREGPAFGVVAKCSGYNETNGST